MRKAAHLSSCRQCANIRVKLTVALLSLGLVGILSLPASAALAASSSVVALAQQTRLLERDARPLTAPLVVPAEQWLDEAQLRQAVEALWASPDAIAAQRASRTMYAHEDLQQAARTFAEVFPDLASQPAGGAPLLPRGERLTGFERANVAQIDLPGRMHGVIDSALPMAVRGASGSWLPVSLGLRKTSWGFEAANPLVRVRLPRRLIEGAELISAGVSLTPVAADGAPLGGGEALSNGTSMLFANTQTATDTVLKPSSRGFDFVSILRSAESPQTLYFRIRVPAGATLTEGPRRGAVEIVKDGASIAIIRPPSAHDAAGVAVPVKMSLAGDVLIVSVPHDSINNLYPIEVDPEIQTAIEHATEDGWQENWFPAQGGGYREEIRNNDELYMGRSGSPFPAHAWAAWFTEAPGYTKLFAVKAAMQWGCSYPWCIGYWAPSGAIERRKGLGPQPEYNKSYCLAVHNEESCSVSAENTLANENGLILEVITLESSQEAEGTISWRCPGYETACLELIRDGYIEAYAEEPRLYFAEETGRHTTVSLNTEAAELDGTNNILRSGGWLSPAEGALELKAHDGGAGVAETRVEYEKSSGKWATAARKSLTPKCKGIRCLENVNETYTYATAELPEGEDHVRFEANPVFAESSSAEHDEGEVTLKVAGTPPRKITLHGLEGTGEDLELGEVDGHVKVEATDGNGTIKSPGIKSLAIEVDEHEIGQPGGSCTAQSGPCTASNEWTINGAELGGGTHTLTVVATDNAGNIGTRTYQLTIDAAAPVSVGPGSVNPESGDLALEASDVDLKGGLGALTVTRHYDSRNVTEGVSGPLGPQWSLGLATLEQLEVLGDGGVAVTGDGRVAIFTPTSEGADTFTAPPGRSNLSLEYEPATSTYVLKDATEGATTEFRKPQGTSVWMPVVTQGAVATDTVTEEYKVVAGEGGDVTVPVREVAPHPTTNCGATALTKLEVTADACRALEFVYYESTSASESQSEWGAFDDRLKEIFAIAYNPATGAMSKTAVARYVYDGQGRLRAEWDPRIEPALKTFYGYDEGGEVVSMTPPGEDPWLFSYGTSQEDTSPGRLVAVTRATAKPSEENGTAPSAVSAPELSTKAPTVGTAVSVNHGIWANAPLGYSYQWMSCQAGSCAPIAGAVSSTYTPLSENRGHGLMVAVTATNAFGAATTCVPTSGSGQGAACVAANASTVGGSGEASQEPAPPAPARVAGTSVETIEYDVPLSGSGLPTMTASAVKKWAQTDDPEKATAIFPPDEPMAWPAADYTRATIYYIDSQARTVNVAAPTGGITTTEYNESGDVKRTLTADNRATALESNNSAEAAEALDTKSAYNSEGQLTEMWGPQHPVRLAHGKLEADEETLARNHVRYFYNEGAKQAEETTHEKYDLVTKTIDAAETPSKEEFDARTTVTGYGAQGPLGWRLGRPTSITVDPGGLNLTTTTTYQESTGAVEETATPGASGKPPLVWNYQSFGTAGSAAAQLEKPGAVAVGPAGQIWIADSANNRIDEYNAEGKFVEAFGWGVLVKKAKDKLEVCTTECKAGLAGSGKGQLDDPRGIVYDPADQELYVSDTGNNRIAAYTTSGKLKRDYGGSAAGSGPGQFSAPAGLAVEPNGDIWVADEGNHRLQRITAKGSFSAYAGVNAGQYSAVTMCGGKLYAVDYAGDRLDELGSEGAVIASFPTASETVRLRQAAAVACDSESNRLLVSDEGAGQILAFNLEGKYIEAFGTGGSGRGAFHEPTGLAQSGATTYVADSGNDRIQAATMKAGNPMAHDRRRIYYTSSENPHTSACGKHEEWAGLLCRTEPAAPSGYDGVPELPTTTYTYNMWAQPEVTTERFGSSERTTTVTYEAERPRLSSETASTGKELPPKALPPITYSYNANNGRLEQQSTDESGHPETLTTVYNKRGEVESYTDADENTARYTYDEDGRIKSFSDDSGGGHEETFEYSKTTGELTELLDSGVGDFTATYDVDGKLRSETYPGGLTAYAAYNSVGMPTRIYYEKTTNCTTNCVWYEDKATPSIHGEVMFQASTFQASTGRQEEPLYEYDAAGRLTAVEEDSAEHGCTTRTFAYNEEGNRITTLTTPPPQGGGCSRAGGEAVSHSYDTANQLVDAGVQYEPFGNVTALPAADTGGHELTSTYYIDGQISSQTQAGKGLEYNLDPEARTRETTTHEQAGGRATTTITHFDGPGDAIAWTSEGDTWTRNVPGVQGEIAAIQTNSGITLELHDLHGDIVATASNSPTASGLLTKYNSTALGEPSNGEAPPKVAWLGEIGAVSELEGGAVTQDGVTYVPQLGHALQTHPIDVAVPVNVISPYQSIEPAAIAESAGRGSEILVAERRRENQERKEREQREREEQEARERREHEREQEFPGALIGEGEVPTSQGPTGSECQGMLACIARHRPSPQIRCTLTTWTEFDAFKKGYLKSFSAGECGEHPGYVLRRGSELAGCVYGEVLEEGEPFVERFACKREGSGFNPEYRSEKGVPLKQWLFVATQPVECESGIKLFGAAEFADPGFSHRLKARTSNVQCGSQSVLDKTEFIIGALEYFLEYVPQAPDG